MALDPTEIAAAITAIIGAIAVLWKQIKTVWNWIKEIVSIPNRVRRLEQWRDKTIEFLEED